MSKIAILFSDNIFDRKGAINATLNRIKYLKSYSHYDITAYCIVPYECWLIRLLRGTPKIRKVEFVEIDGNVINLLWYTFSLVDYILYIKLHGKAVFRSLFSRKLIEVFKNYDLLSVHSDFAGEIALLVHEKYNIPYCVTWHGSDIHTSPFINSNNFLKVKKIMKNACCNFFVSRALLICSDKILKDANKRILYNGVSEDFYVYDECKRRKLRNKEGISNECKIVAFVGNLFPIKNADILPELFSAIKKKYEGELIFWIIGGGKLRSLIESKLKKMTDINCRFFGNQPVSLMPDYMNCIDVLILPSKNEGLPLVTVEALKCGANVVGSNVGGIKEVVGEENVIDINNLFIDKFSARVAYILTSNGIKQDLPGKFDWKRTANLEAMYYQNILVKSCQLK